MKHLLLYFCESNSCSAYSEAVGFTGQHGLSLSSVRIINCHLKHKLFCQHCEVQSLCKVPADAERRWWHSDGSAVSGLVFPAYLVPCCLSVLAAHGACLTGFFSGLGFISRNMEMRWIPGLSFHQDALWFAFSHPQLSVSFVVH